jgi:hypothetical protein
MSLRPNPNHPDLYQHTDTGQIFNMRDFHPWELTSQFQRNREIAHRLRVSSGETRLLERWAVVLHPWHEVIPPSLTVDLIINDLMIVHAMPLFRIAEPLKRSSDCDLERRLLKLEEVVRLTAQRGDGVVPTLGEHNGRNPSGKLDTQVLNQHHELWARINGPSDDFGPLMEMTKHFMLRLQGRQRFIVR